MIHLNKNPIGKLHNVTFAICQLVDALVRLFSFGFLFTDLPKNCVRKATKTHFEKIKRKGK